MKNNWKEEFDNYFLEKIGKDDGYTEERRIVKDFIESLLAEQKKELIDECITLSDLIESQNITVFDEWRAFKQFRNTLRNKLKHHD